MATIKKKVTGPLQIKSTMVSLEFPKVSESAVEESKVALKMADDSNRKSFMQLVNAHKVLDVAEHDSKPFEVEVQVITLGNALAWVALPGEIFVELGLDFKSASPFKQTMVVELANVSIGYVPIVRELMK